MKKLFLALSLLLLAGCEVDATNLTVTATAIRDANGNPYANGTVSGELIFGTGPTPTAPGAPVVFSTGPSTLNSVGTLVGTMTVTDTSTITPAGATYRFTVCGTSTPLGPAVPVETVCYRTAYVTIVGPGPVDISSILNASAALLGPALGGGGGAGNGGQAWSSAVTYDAGDIVSQGGSVYISIAGSNFNHMPPNVAYWTAMAGTTFNGGTVTGPTYFTSGRPSWDVVCTNNMAADTAAFQAMITAVELATALENNPGGEMNVWGKCVFGDINFGAYRLSSRIYVNAYGPWSFGGTRGFRLRPNNDTIAYPYTFRGVRGGNALTAFVFQQGTEIINTAGNFPMWDLQGITGTEITGWSMRQFGTAPAVHVHAYEAPLPAVTHCPDPVMFPCGTIQINVHDNHISSEDGLAIPLIVDSSAGVISGFSMNFENNVLAVNATGPAVRVCRIVNAGEVAMHTTIEGELWWLNGSCDVWSTGGAYSADIKFRDISGEGQIGAMINTQGSINRLILEEMAPSDTIGAEYAVKVHSGTASVYFKNNSSNYFTQLIAPDSLPVDLMQGSDTDKSMFENLNNPLVRQQPGSVFNGSYMGRLNDLALTGTPIIPTLANVVTNYDPAVTPWVSAGYGTATITTGQADYLGTNMAGRVAVTSAPYDVRVYARSYTPVVGDKYLAVIPIKMDVTGGLGARLGMAFTGGTSTVNGGNGAFSFETPTPAGIVDGKNWKFYKSIIKVTATDGGAKDLNISAGSNDTSSPFYMAFPTVYHIPNSAGITDAQALDWLQSMVPTAPSCVLGQPCTAKGPMPLSSGNIATATALQADPADCIAGQAGRGINAAGTAVNCTAYKQVIANGTKALATAAIANNACSAQTAVATGALTTDSVTYNANASISGVTGYAPVGTLTVTVYPSVDTINFDVCNKDQVNPVTPGAVTLTWTVTRP